MSLFHPPVAVLPIEKGGSGRKFWRLRAGGESLILVRYGEDRPENKHYVAIARFLASVGVRVPVVHFHDDAEGLIVMEDAGDTDLWSFRETDWLTRRALYQRTLDQALALHTRAHLAAESQTLQLQQQFDAALYRWEQEYFIEHCLGRHYGVPDSLDRAPLHAAADRLAAEPRCLVHRDFQSQNVIVRDGEVCLIDFQGLRPGLAQYDLASLLLDPYASLTPHEREELLAHYLSGRFGPGQAAGAEWRTLYDLCAAQRLMQALGAYGKLGHTDARTTFLEHIPVAMERLQDVLARLPELSGLHALVARLRVL